MAGVYLLLKCGRLVEQSALVAASAKAVLLREAAYGNYAKPEEVMEAGNHCSICQVGCCLRCLVDSIADETALLPEAGLTDMLKQVLLFRCDCKVLMSK